jgi:hypothetical protein
MVWDNETIAIGKVAIKIRVSASDYVGPRETVRRWHYSLTLFGRQIGFCTDTYTSEALALKAAKREVRNWSRDNLASEQITLAREVAREVTSAGKQHQVIDGVCELCDAGDPTSIIKLSDPCEG